MNSLLLKSAGFLVFETIMILVLRAYTDVDDNSEFLFWSMIVATAAGYLLLGIFAGSLLTFPVALLPIGIAYLIEPSVSSEPGTEEWTMAWTWAFFSLVGFLPLWLFGYFVHFAARNTSEDPT